MTIYNGLRETASRFDVFLFDAYGVFWEGNGFYPGSKELMGDLVRQGKIVVVVSNTTQLHDDMVNGYVKRDFLAGRDCHYFVSSGEVLRQALAQERLTFQSCLRPQKYYVVGLPHIKAFAGTSYQQVETPEEADFIYCGIPYLFAADVAAYPQYQDKYWPVRQDESGAVCLWDTETEAPFADRIAEIAALKKPVLNANPDFTAKEGHRLVAGAEAVFVVRNGLIAEMFRRHGVEVLEFGKPHRNIYDYTFEMLRQQGIVTAPERICMVGDTVRTDIKGAVSVGISPVLCVDTGVTAQKISEGYSVKKLCESENIDVQQIIQIKSVGG